MLSLFQARPESECMVESPAGFSYVEFSCIYPILEYTYLPIEKKYEDFIGNQTWDFIMKPENIVYPLLAVTLYGISLPIGKKYMDSRKPWQWRNQLAAWNLFLCTFSAIGMLRTVPQVFHYLSTWTLKENMCNDIVYVYGHGSSGMYYQLFTLSKFIELIDTFFIIIHKKPLIFLHWYHHVTVLVYCWYASSLKAPTCPFFSAMNYSVHAFMYGYYFLMAIRAKPKWLNPIFITLAQISQMIAGVTLTSMGFYYFLDAKKNGYECAIEQKTLTAAAIMYGSYLYLFLEFFFGRFFKKKEVTKKKTV